MKRSLFGTLGLLTVLFSFALMCEVTWALKNVCPNCKTMIKNLDLAACPNCGKIINKCLICGYINPIKNDNCYKCSASLAESRVSRTIEKETRDELRLGESPRSRIDVELQQIEQKVAMQGWTPELAARQVELLTKMGWWSLANATAIEFSSRYPLSEQTTQVAAWRVTSLKKLGFLALEEKNNEVAMEYLKTAISIDPRDKETRDLLKMAGTTR